MELKDIDVSKLKGVALDYVVAKMMFQDGVMISRGLVLVDGCLYMPSVRWDHCGRLIDHFKVELGFDVTEENEPYYAIYFDEHLSGSSYQEAACRVIVHIHGDNVLDIPDELLKE